MNKGQLQEADKFFEDLSCSEYLTGSHKSIIAGLRRGIKDRMRELNPRKLLDAHNNIVPISTADTDAQAFETPPTTLRVNADFKIFI
jgi:hypothetical protein